MAYPEVIPVSKARGRNWSVTNLARPDPLLGCEGCPPGAAALWEAEKATCLQPSER